MYRFIYQCIYQKKNKALCVVFMAVKLVYFSEVSQADGFREQGVEEDMLD
jgi:hypothetical protein